MVRGSRTLPLVMDEAHGWGVGPGGGARSIVAGERVVSWADGSIAAAADRLPRAPTGVLELPERLGGGFVFALGSTLLRSDTWLGPTRPLAAPPGNVSQLIAGLDRVYVRTQQGTLVAYDARRDAMVELGPLPAAPTVGRLAALDAWRAVAIADTRGALLTLDAGATWRPLHLPIDAADVVTLGDSIAVGGLDESRQVQWWEVRPDGQTGRLPAAPSGSAEAAVAPPSQDPVGRAFGARPLAAAIEDGWPLTDGTALVARDGALARVRIQDGALVEAVTDAFPLRPARCHAVSIATRRDPGAFGFVCGEPHGPTVVYRWDGAAARVVEMRRFEGPREVLAFGNGALAARGGCADDAPSDASDDVAWCLMPPGGAWSEMHFRGEEVDRARVVVLGDGRVALVRPPRGGDLSTARLTITDGAHSSHVSVALPSLRADVTRALRVGLWLDGFEERRPGVVGGWVDAGGAVVGVEIALDGQADVGTLVRSAGEVFVAGRWGFGWTASRRGLETTDGGMTWKELEMPDTIAPARAVRERACGPIGCLAAGWMRVGWGEPEKVDAKTPPPVRTARSPRAAPSLDLECEPLAGRPPEPKQPATLPRRAPAPPPALLSPPRRWTGAVLGGTTWVGSDQLPAFYGRAAPPFGADDLGVSTEVSTLLERSVRSQPDARLYAWGPRSGDWDQLGRWQVRWLWPYGGWPEVRSSSVAPAPWAGIEAARHGLGIQAPPQSTWVLVPGDDADHALLVARRTTSTVSADVLVLETDRAPLEVRRANGDPFPDVEGAVRAGGRWYLATLQPTGELSATVVWLLDGVGAREVGRVPRGGFETRPALRLARRTDGRSLALVVDGQTDDVSHVAQRWVVPLDLESGALGDPEPLAPADLSDRRVAACTGEDGGWTLDLPYPAAVRIHAPPAAAVTMSGPLARLRVSREKACVERMMGSVEGYAPAATGRGLPLPLGQRRGADMRTIDVAAFSAQVRYPLRCVVR
jgi:hypothetical protein